MRKILDMISAQQVQCCDVDFSFEIDWEAIQNVHLPHLSVQLFLTQSRQLRARVMQPLLSQLFAVGKEEDSAQQVCPVP